MPTLTTKRDRHPFRFDIQCAGTDSRADTKPFLGPTPACTADTIGPRQFRFNGRLAQRESTCLARRGSGFRNSHCPPFYMNNLLGRKFGKLTVTAEVGTSTRGILWSCLCECGSTIVLGRNKLTSNNTKSCGCLKHKSVTDTGLYEVLRDYKRRQSQFELTDYQFSELLQGSCAYCGLVRSNACKTRCGVFSYNGIDRVDSRLGYTVGNSVSCCKYCNRMKSNMTQVDFLAHVRRIHNFQSAATPKG